MTETLYKFVDGEHIAMSEEEAAAFEAERAALVTVRRYSPLQFMELFSQEEQLIIVSASMSNAMVKLWYDKMLAASEIVLTDERVTSGLAALVDAGLLAQERVDAIMGGA